MRKSWSMIRLLTILNHPVVRIVYLLTIVTALIVGGGAPEILGGH
jgi:hypothetical protein